MIQSIEHIPQLSPFIHVNKITSMWQWLHHIMHTLICIRFVSQLVDWVKIRTIFHCKSTLSLKQRDDTQSTETLNHSSVYWAWTSQLNSKFILNIKYVSFLILMYANYASWLNTKVCINLYKVNKKHYNMIINSVWVLFIISVNKYPIQSCSSFMKTTFNPKLKYMCYDRN